MGPFSRHKTDYVVTLMSLMYGLLVPQSLVSQPRYPVLPKAWTRRGQHPDSEPCPV